MYQVESDTYRRARVKKTVEHVANKGAEEHAKK